MHLIYIAMQKKQFNQTYQIIVFFELWVLKSYYFIQIVWISLKIVMNFFTKIAYVKYKEAFIKFWGIEKSNNSQKQQNLNDYKIVNKNIDS